MGCGRGQERRFEGGIGLGERGKRSRGNSKLDQNIEERERVCVRGRGRLPLVTKCQCMRGVPGLNGAERQELVRRCEGSRREHAGVYKE